MRRAEVVVIGEGRIPFDRILAVAKGEARVRVSADKQFMARIKRTQALLAGAIKDDVPVYGVNTGYGKSCGKRIPVKSARKVASPLDFHGCGTGEPIGIEETRAAMVCRMICLAMGYSGASLDLLKQIEAFLNLGITPVVPSEGSVGASGDLTPMSYIAACLEGDREVFYQGKRMPTARALKLAGIGPYKLRMKEALSMMNGTTTMTGIAVLAVDRARRILDAVICATALTLHAFKGKAHHFDPLIGAVKPFAGQIHVAERLQALLKTRGDSAALEEQSPEALQDPYSIRCTPQIAGVLYDALAWIEPWVETEANSCNDNPIFNPETGEPLMSGNFYGGHIAFAMDALKAAVAAIADLSDRQIILLVNPHTSRGLPADLVGATGEDFLLNHGFKAISITATALCAEALKLTMPAASFSRSCESHNQDKVSLGTIAARDALRICTLVERAVAIHLLAAAQGCDLRGTIGRRPALKALLDKIRFIAEGIVEDRPMDGDIEALATTIAHTDLFQSTVTAGARR